MRRLVLLVGMVVPLLLAGCTSFRTAASSQPSGESVTRTIGASGGHADFPGGSIAIPPAAFPTDTTVQVTRDSRARDTVGPDWHPIGPAIRVELSRQPSSPLTLTIRTALPAGVDPHATFLAARLSAAAAAAAARTDPPNAGATSPSQVVLLPLTADAGVLTASLPGAGWFGAAWLDAKAAAEKVLPQLGQGFLEFAKLRAPRPTDCADSVTTPSGVVSFDSAPWRDDPDPDIWACLGAVQDDAGKVSVTLTDNRPILWQGSLPAGSAVTHRDLLTDLVRGNGYALLVQGLNDLSASAGGRSGGPELGPASAITVDVPISALDGQLTFVPDRYAILLGALDFGLHLLMSVELGAATVIRPIADDVECLVGASLAFADRLNTILDSGTMTLENFVFLADVAKDCWQKFVNTGSEVVKGYADFVLLLLTSGLPAMYNAIDPVVRMLSGATSVAIPLHLEPAGTPPVDGSGGGGGEPGAPAGGPEGGAGTPDQTPLPDLVPINYQATTDCGQQWLEAEIANVGQADAGPFTSQWLLDGVSVATYPLPGLVAGGKRVFDFPMSALTPGPHTAVMEVNVGGQATESNTANDRLGQQDTWPTCASAQPAPSTTTEPPHDYTGGLRLPCLLPDGSQGEIERWTGECGPVQGG